MTILLLRWAWVSILAMVAVLLLRALTKNRLSHRARYALWLPVLLRMLFPRFLGQSPVAAANLAPLPTFSSEPVVSEAPAALSPWAVPSAGAGDPLPWLPLLWAAGVALVLFCLLASNLLFRRRLAQTRQRLEEEESCPLPLYQAENLSSPLLLGLFRPAIYLPRHITEQVRSYALAHELTHWRHGDPLWTLLRGLALALHWYHPLAWLCLSLSRLDGELACDEGVLARLGQQSRLDYGRALTDLASQRENSPLWGPAMAGEQNRLALRVQALLHQPRQKPAVLICSAAAVMLLAPFIFLGPRSGPLSPQQAMEQLSGSLSYQEGGVTFTLPAGYQTPEDWNIHIAGRVVYPDGFSRSVHFFDSENQAHSWQAGQRYMIALDEQNSCVELTMEAWLPDGKGGRCYLSLDLLAADALQIQPAPKTFDP